jgi:hypothetical protein
MFRCSIDQREILNDNYTLRTHIKNWETFNLFSFFLLLLLDSHFFILPTKLIAITSKTIPSRFDEKYIEGRV